MRKTILWILVVLVTSTIAHFLPDYGFVNWDWVLGWTAGAIIFRNNLI